MIRQLRKNRKSRGASLLIAILVFFLAALSGTVVLTMAESNAGRYTHEKEDQQAYLAVASASKLILDQLGGVQVRFDGNKTEVPQSSADVTLKFYKKGAETTEELTDLGLFFKDSRFIKQLEELPPYGEQVEGSGDTEEPEEPEEPTPIPEGYKPVSFTLSVEGDEKSAVLVEFDMHEKTILTIRLWYAENGHKSYQMTVYVDLDDIDQWETTGTGTDTKYYTNLTWQTDSATYSFEREYSDKNPDAEEEGDA